MPLSRITSKSIDDSTIITTGLLADSSVTTVKLADSSVSTDKLLDNTVTTLKLVDSSVTDAKISNVQVSKISGAGIMASLNNISVANVTGNFSVNNNLLAQLHAIALSF